MSDEMSGEKFHRQIDKSKIPTCKILGVNIAAINMGWLMDFIVQNIGMLSGDYITVANVHTTVISYENSEYCNIQNRALMAIPDGGPLSALGRGRGYQEMQRTTGPNFMEEIFKRSREKGWRHYFYGSTKETLDKISDVLKNEYPELIVAGMYSPPFRSLTKDEDDWVVNQINLANPDFIWVSLGAPKQENWMAEHQGRIIGLMVGVGAAFDYFAGNLKRAPIWMQRSSLEWVYRLYQEPKRLVKRYLMTNSKFIWNAIIRGK